MTGEDEIQVEDDDIGAQIRAAAEQVSSAKLGDKLSSADVPSSPEAEVPESSAERPRDASGKFIPKAAVEQADAPVKQITDADRLSEQPAQPSNAATPPTSWSADAKAQWASLPPAVQQAAFKRESEMAEGQRQWSEQRQQLEQVIAPLHQLSQQNGINWQEGLNRLLNVESGLRNPSTAAQTVQQLAAAYGVDLAALVNGSPQPQRQVQQSFDPNVIPQLVEQTVSQRLAAWQQDQALNSEITGFASQRGPDGQPAHPHFETVKQAMGLLLQSGQAKSMQEAYDKAIWINPETRPQPQIQVQSQQQQVNKAKRAAVSPTGAPVNGVAKPKGFDAGQSLVDDIREAAAMVSRH